MSIPEFAPFPKIARWSREVVVTEKLDGTNAQVFVSDDGTQVLAGSRNRWLTPEADNFGFASWVQTKADELRALGPGAHFGEWWGAGIQRRYSIGEKRFSLFNVHRWADGGKDKRPACCHVVPEIWRGNLDELSLTSLLAGLRTNGSAASPGFRNPEGVVLFHVASGTLFKKTLEKDSEPKGAP